ncbi:type II and III secretion system protein family protein [Devosia sp. PTR5]|uniref:Type II and III secretion system protein family protein n=1 Tax=Devosia oryzisoli TaxID=2774138 RepID=A0A927FVQ1_9HYPH|nr:type II and III secretion system protein family protein [Devosia oryzisoli]MBD8065708.1 type II and III secretion system protein family protein [Devosia oryzisoli]
MSRAMSFPFSRLRRPLLATALAAVLAGAPAAAQAADMQMSVASSAYGGTRSTELNINKSMILDLPAGVSEVVVSQPAIAAAIMRTRTRAIIQGISSGNTNIIFLDDAGRTIQVLDLRVTSAPSQVGNALESALARVIPGSNIRVESVTLSGETNRVVLTGSVLSSEDRDRAVAVATQFAGSPENVASIIDVVGAQQVMLQVTVSEVKRDVAKQFGINLGASFSVGTTTLGFNNQPMNNTFTPSGVDASFNIGSVGITAAIRALEARGALRVLAQPTLTAISGEEANFLAGGELPYSTYDTTKNTQTVIFKPYGVELKFTPVVKSNGVISLKVDTSVSEPQADFSITKRQAATSVELASGTTLAVGGLLQETSRQQINQLPVLGNIPILGALFRSRDYQNEQTELVILVTPYLVNPSPANTIAVPTDNSTMASDAETIFLGAMERKYGVAKSGNMRGGYSGSVGFVLD